MPTIPGAVLLQANTLHIPLADQSVHMVLTSPPYFGLRDFQTAEWHGGTEDCSHVASERWYTEKTAAIASHEAFSVPGQANIDRLKQGRWRESGQCVHCGATRIDHQIGLEKLPDCLGWATGENCGSCYLCHMRAVMRECWRVLRNDGTCWVVVGDSYAAGKAGRTDHGSGDPTSKLGPARNGIPGGTRPGPVIPRRPSAGLKPKDLCLIPQRLALALQADGWTVRSDIVWNKPSCMPESVTDRCTRSHEYVWLLTKQPRYYFDSYAVREVGITGYSIRNRQQYNRTREADPRDGRVKTFTGLPSEDIPEAGRNLRSVWTITSEPTPFAHFATMPTALACRCILAGTSAYGVCSVCGKPWVRVVERERLLDGTIPVHGAFCRPEDPFRIPANGKGHWRYNTVTSELGWRAGCTHDAPVVPAIVLDPFVGSGTTVLAAHALGRHSVGLDLSFAYLATIARPRLTAQVQAAQERQAEQDAQPDLFALPAPRWIQQPLFG